jgi:hypothetical protein
LIPAFVQKDVCSRHESRMFSFWKVRSCLRIKTLRQTKRLPYGTRRMDVECQFLSQSSVVFPFSVQHVTRSGTLLF